MQGDDDGDERLDAAVSLGIISADQARAIRGLAPARRDQSSRRVPKIGAANIGYVLGAITVVIAMGWFLSDRWQWLGAWGVLAVAALYCGLFLVVARRLGTEGYRAAGGFAVLLAVCTVPVAAVAVLELVGWIDPPPARSCSYPEFALWTCRGQEIVVELATLAAALIALRAVRFSLLVVPIAALVIRFGFHIAAAMTGAGLGSVSIGWMWMIAGSVMTAVAYWTSREQRGDEDFALWLHLAAAFCAVVASAVLVNAFDNFRHLLIPSALVAFAFSLRMRRFVWTLLGMAWFVVYLGWLASDVFKDTPFFPIVLAALGIGVIIATVWVQRNSEELVARFGGLAPDDRPSFPGGIALLLIPALVAAIQLPAAAELDRALARIWNQPPPREASDSLPPGVRERLDSLPPTPRNRPETPPAPRP